MQRRYTALLAILILVINIHPSHAQKPYDTLVHVNDSVSVKMMAYPLKDELLLYRKPKPFGFVTQFPRTFANAAKQSFRKESLPAWGIITASTLALIAGDQKITDGVQQFSRYIGLDATRKYKTILPLKIGSLEVNTYDFPRNLNSVFYTIGEGSTSIFIAGGMFLYGKINRDYRSLQTASQIVQTGLVVGVVTQVLKRASGRESPFVASKAGGEWRPFTNPSVYQKTVPKHDAFPSGHLASMVATFVVISDNYPEKKWIKITGYTLMSLTSFAMINNGVHWAGDYPLAIGIGYVVGKVSVKMNRLVQHKSAPGKTRE